MAKGKRWKKGQSSSSNPESRKYRDISKNNKVFSFGPLSSNEKSSLTAKALQELNSESNAFDSNDTHELLDDNESIDTFKSWASNWSDCTNATFNKVHRYWRSNSALHKEILAVLAAVTEIIKEKKGKESEIEYFAALMTGIESVKGNEDSTTAFIYLIALAIKKVPENVLRVKYLQILNTLMQPLIDFGEKSSNVTLIKSGLMCLCWLLKSQDQIAWKSEKTQNAFMLILSFIDHSKPKIRKCGQEAIRLILNSCSSTRSNSLDEISSFTAEYCLDLIKNGNKLNNNNSKKPKHKDSKESTTVDAQTQTILHTLSLIKQIVHFFELNILRSVGECLLRLMTLKDILITSLCFQVLHELFESKINNLSAEINGQMINALYDYEPSENDPQQLIAWLAVVESAIKCLNRLDKQICISHLPVVFQKFMSTLSSSHHKNVHVMSTNCLCTILEQCVETNIGLFVEDIKQTIEIKKSLLGKIFSHIETGLSYQYHASWSYVMKILACAFTSFKHCDTFLIVEKCLSSLANLKESEQFEYKKEADLSIGKAIKTYGPKLVIGCIPLEITGDENNYDFPRSWMLPLLKENIEKTELAYFIDYFFPIAKKLKTKADHFKNCKKLIESKIFENLQNQIWSLLPGFCDFCVDFKEKFKVIAKTLGETLEKCPDLRYYILHSLKNLINRNEGDNKALMGKFAKNYLPIMFNIYTTEIAIENESIRQTFLDTIKCYLEIADPELVNLYISQAINNLENYSKLTEKHQKEIEIKKSKDASVVFDFNTTKKETLPIQLSNLYVFAKHGFMDLLAILVKFSNDSNIPIIFELAVERINDSTGDKTDQKKCYKILNAILNSGKLSSKQTRNQSVFSFIENKFESIVKVFTSSLGKCNAAAKVPRLKCLINLMDYVVKPEQRTIVRFLLPEIILCVKELNHISRETAFQLLNSMLRLWQKLGINSAEPTTENDSLNEFFHLVMVGLAGSTNMISCTCIAMASLVHEFRDQISGSLIGELIETACLLSKSEIKEIIISSMNLLKTLCSVFPTTTLAQYLKKISDVIYSLHEKRGTNMAEENSFNNMAPVSKSQQIRSLVKLTLKKLIKKFTYQIIFENIFAFEKPSHDKTEDKRILTAIIKQGLENLLTNLRKSIEKDKKRKMEEKNTDKNSDKNIDLVSLYTSKTNKTTTNESKYNEIEDLLKESDSESEIAKDDKSQKTNKTKKGKIEKNKVLAQSNPLAWIQENESDDPLDLLDPMAIKRVFATKPLTKEEIEIKKNKESLNRSKNRGFTLTSDGKIMINDDDISAKVVNKKPKSDEIEEMMDTLSLSKKSFISRKSNKLKRSAGDMDDSEDEDDTKSKRTYKTGGTGIHRKLDKSSKQVSSFGADYKAKKARGDVKKKNMPDPYAYIPFNMSKLNKRKKAKLQGEYKGVVKAVKRGAQKAKNKKTNR